MSAAVLLVDDERFARTVYSDYLRLGGHDVEVADSAAAALDALRKRHFDLLITDVILPGADGLALLAEAKRLDPNLGAIVITALDRVDPAVRAMKAGASDYLVKPVTPETLQIAVHRCLSTRALLAENQALRHSLRLMESCGRITSAPDAQAAIGLALSAVASELGAGEALFLESGDAGPSLAGRHGLDDESARALAAALAAEPRWRPGAGRAPRWPGGLRWPAGAGLAVSDEGRTLGWLVLDVAPPAPELRATADFVAGQLALALRTLGSLAQAQSLAYLDDLTHLYNTRFLDVVLDRELASGRSFSVLFMDLDRFKAVNDAHGHLVGSQLLVEVGRMVKGCVRDEDVVVRYGGDEYVAVLLGVDSGGALKVAERVRRTVEDHVFLAREGPRLHVTVSIGIASCPEHTRSKAEVLELADRAMYRGKRSTRNVIYMA